MGRRLFWAAVNRVQGLLRVAQWIAGGDAIFLGHALGVTVLRKVVGRGVSYRPPPKLSPYPPWPLASTMSRVGK